MKHFLLTIFFSITAIAAMSQYRYRVETCWEMAKNNYPAIKYFDLIEKSRDFSLSNASELKMPRKLDIVSYSTSEESKKSAISLANRNNISLYNAQFSIKNPSKNQNVLVTGSLQANLYILSERVNNLFFSLVLIDKQIKTNEMLQLQLVELSKLFTTSKDNRLNNSINLKGIVALQDNAKKDYSTLINLQRVYYDMLSQMVGRTIDKRSVLILPDIEQYLKRSNALKSTGLIDNNKYNPFTNNINIAPKNTIQESNNYNLFDIARVKPDYQKNNQNSNQTKNNVSTFQSLLNNNQKKQQDFERSEINLLCAHIDNDLRSIEYLKEYILISFNKMSRGATDISNFTQNILNYLNAHNQLSAHTVQLMMEANKFKFLYE